MIPRFAPPFKLSDIGAALAARGPDDIAAFEGAFAALAGQAHAVSFPYGRTALIAILNAIGAKDREVICPAYTCVVVPHAIRFAGARPVFVDCGADANMDLDLAEAQVNERTVAIIATSVFGHPVDLDRLAAFRTRHPNVAVLQDCAHSFMAEWRGQSVNKAGLAAFYGLNASKIMSSIFGGITTTDDADFAQKLRQQRAAMVTPTTAAKTLSRLLYLTAIQIAFTPLVFGMTEALRQAGALNAFTQYYDPSVVDMPRDYLSGFTPLEARVGRAQCARYADMIAARRAFAAHYHKALAGTDGLIFVPSAPGATYSHIAARVADRPAVMKACARRGVQLGEIIEYNCADMPAYADVRGDGAWPIAAAFARQAINLPVAPRFSENTARRVVEVVRDVLRGAQPPDSSSR